MMTKILVAPLGDPSKYEEVEYRLNGQSKKGALSPAIIESDKTPDKALFIVGDTLAASYGIKEGDYKSIVQKIKERVSSFLDKQLDNHKYEIIVAPAVITSGNYSFTGSMLDYYYYILYHLASNLLDSNYESIDMHVDVTHGVNYMSILCYRAVIDILEWLALFYDVNITVYNSDPVFKGMNKYIVNINKIEERTIRGRPLPELLSNNARPIKSEDSKKIDASFKLLKMKKNEINAFIGSIYNGLPLALYTFYNEHSDIKNIIDIALDIFEENINVQMNNGVRIDRKVSFENDFKICIYAYITSRLLKKQYCVSRINENDGIDIENLNKITREFFKYDRRLSIRIDKDLFDIKYVVENNKGVTSEWVDYTRLSGKSRGEPDERNFLAHSGLEHNLIEVINNGKIRLRYNKERRDRARTLCVKGLV